MSAENIVERLEAIASREDQVFGAMSNGLEIREAAAEIGRLRGEVARLEGVALADELIAGATRSFGGAIAPAEAKDPAPAMPNGVEAVQAVESAMLNGWNLHAPDARRMAEAAVKALPFVAYAYSQGIQGAEDAGRDLEDALRAADNRDAAGVDRTNGDAQPAGGEAVADPCDVCHGSGEIDADLGECAQCRGVGCTTPPAPVQAAAQEGEVPRLVRYGRGPAESPYLLDQRDDGYWTPWHVAQRELARALAAHPPACELGAVRELIQKWRVPSRHAGQQWIDADARQRCADELEAALQHRGDSQEVGRG